MAGVALSSPNNFQDFNQGNGTYTALKQQPPPVLWAPLSLYILNERVKWASSEEDGVSVMNVLPVSLERAGRSYDFTVTDWVQWQGWWGGTPRQLRKSISCPFGREGKLQSRSCRTRHWTKHIHQTYNSKISTSCYLDEVIAITLARETFLGPTAQRLRWSTMRHPPSLPSLRAAPAGLLHGKAGWGDNRPFSKYVLYNGFQSLKTLF